MLSIKNFYVVIWFKNGEREYKEQHIVAADSWEDAFTSLKPFAEAGKLDNDDHTFVRMATFEESNGYIPYFLHFSDAAVSKLQNHIDSSEEHRRLAREMVVAQPDLERDW